MNLLSFSSKVVYGHVGHSAAKLLLERLGHTVWAIDTVTFAHHPGHGPPAGRVTPPDEIRALGDALEALGLLAGIGSVFTGYLGTAANGEAALDWVGRVKSANRDALFACDPVMGERTGGLYVAGDLPDFFARRAIPLADVALPNAFELERLCGLPVHDIGSAVLAADHLRALGPRLVVVTGVELEHAIATVVVASEGAWAVRTPRLSCRAHGTGDAFAALFLGHLYAGKPAPVALQAAVGGVYALIEATAGAVELSVIAAQDQAVRPSRTWRARRLR
ncbi:MAG TPA: pyridoxal kinase [Alphaproteobacteria bacterium]|nr:pyridoxal kinase [Alphaproteobacteria bacterium]